MSLALCFMHYLIWQIPMVDVVHIIFQDKKSLKLGPDDNLHIEGFASSVFSKADKQDRAGRSDLYANFLTPF